MEVAQALGLSTYTVSRALNGHTDVSQATRERVVDAARKMNYSASAMGATLRKGRTDTLCLMLTPSPGTLIDSYFLPVITGLDRILNPAGYSILIAGAASDAQESNLLRRMVEGRRADVVVLTRVRRDDSRARELRKLNFPFAMLGRDADDPASPFVDVDHYAMDVTATRWLIDRGA